MTKTARKAQVGEVVQRNTLDDLRTRLGGDLILPGTPGYDE